MWRGPVAFIDVEEPRLVTTPDQNARRKVKPPEYAGYRCDRIWAGVSAFSDSRLRVP